MDPLVTFLIITRNRGNELSETLTSILAQQYHPFNIVVVDNASTDETPALIKQRFNFSNLTYFRSNTNLGVCGGRNLGIKQATGDFIFTIDDDAVLKDPYAVKKVIDRLKKDRSIGALALRSVNYFSGELEKGAFPSRNKTIDATKEFETTWFIGVGHIIPQLVYEKVGLFNEYFPYGHEELDLSLRIIDAGYRIVYFPEVVVYHRKIDTGNKKKWRETNFQAIQLHNRIKVAIRNLPWRYVLTTDIMRSGQVLLQFTRFNLFAVILAHWYIAKQFPRLIKERKLLRDDTIRYVIKMKGPVFY